MAHLDALAFFVESGFATVDELYTKLLQADETTTPMLQGELAEQDRAYRESLEQDRLKVGLVYIYIFIWLVFGLWLAALSSLILEVEESKEAGRSIFHILYFIFIFDLFGRCLFGSSSNSKNNRLSMRSAV